MKKDRVVFWSTITVLIIGAFSIGIMGMGSDVVAKTDKDNYNFAFNLDVVSTNRQDDIEFVSASGKNTKNLEVTFLSDGKCSSIKGGKKKKTILCKCETKNNYTRIDSLKLKINGEEKDIKLRVPIENRSRSNIIFLKNH